MINSEFTKKGGVTVLEGLVVISVAESTSQHNRMASSDQIAAETVVDKDVVLSLHEHPLILIDTQRRKDSAELFGLSKSFVCEKCAKLRYRFIRYCQECDVRVCHECYNASLQEQLALIRETIALEFAAEEERNKLFSGGAGKQSFRIKLASQGLPLIMGACIAGDSDTVREMVEKNEFSGKLDLEQVCEVGEHKGKTMLLLAAEFGHRQITVLLLGRGSKTSACDNRGMTPLMHAAFGGHVEVLDELLFARVQVDHTAFCGYTALLFAANKGHTACVQRLLAAGARVTTRTPGGRTPLIVAAVNGHLSTVELLLKNMKLDDILAADFEGYTAKDAAIARGHCAVEAAIDRRILKG